jgi:serine/threonine protein kinase
MADPKPDEIIAGKYRVVRMLGRGGMGSVWEGKHETLGTRVAIKFIDPDHAESAEARARFENEAKAAATIQSKYAIQIFDHGTTDDGRPYIVMEMLSGEPLDKRLDRLGALPLQEVARIVQQVSRGLGKAHEKGIIHRDLKPENVFLTLDSDEGAEVAKVLDFGIAKLRGDSNLAIGSGTRTGAILGTPYYMSPEQARGLKDIDHRADLWSLAVMAYRCAIGKLPFDGESVGDLLVKICTAPLPVPSRENPALPQMFDGWFAKALERDPNGRFQNANDFSESLAEIAGITVRRSAGLPNVAGAASTALVSSGGVSSGNPIGYPSSGQAHAAQQAPGQGYGSGNQPGYPNSYGQQQAYPNAGAVGHQGYMQTAPSPYAPYMAGTPLPGATATSAGLSTSTGFNTYRQPKKSSAWIWILSAVFGIMGLGGIAIAALVLRDDPPPTKAKIEVKADSVDVSPSGVHVTAGSHTVDLSSSGVTVRIGESEGSATTSSTSNQAAVAPNPPSSSKPSGFPGGTTATSGSAKKPPGTSTATTPGTKPSAAPTGAPSTSAKPTSSGKPGGSGL